MTPDFTESEYRAASRSVREYHFARYRDDYVAPEPPVKRTGPGALDPVDSGAVAPSATTNSARYGRKSTRWPAGYVPLTQAEKVKRYRAAQAEIPCSVCGKPSYTGGRCCSCHVTSTRAWCSRSREKQGADIRCARIASRLRGGKHLARNDTSAQFVLAPTSALRENNS
jgi:hypothetical protein